MAEDAPELGRVMVESWLSAHRGQMPDDVWQKRVDEWTPDVSARAWTRVLVDRAAGGARGDVLLVAEDGSGALQALVYGTPAEDDVPGAGASISALYVSTHCRGRGIGTALLGAAARELAAFGFATLRVEVLSANVAARRFYEGTGALEAGQSTFDEEGCLLPATVYEWPDGNVLLDEHLL